MHSKDFSAHAGLRDNNGRVHRIGKTDPLAWDHLQARTHVKAEPACDRDRAYIARRNRREMRRGIAHAAVVVGGVALVVLAFALWVVTTFAGVTV